MTQIRFFCIALILTFLLSCSDGDNSGNSNSSNPTIEIQDDNVVLQENISSTTTAKFTSSDEWVLESSTEWFDVNPKRGNKGSVTLDIESKQNNPFYEDRNAFIRVKSGETIKTITVTQKKREAILLSRDKVELSATDNDFSLLVKSNVAYEVIIPDDSKDWITHTKKKSLRNGLIETTENFTVAPASEAGQRKGSVIFKKGNLSEVVTVYQSQRDVLVLTNNTVNVERKGSDLLEIELKSNIDYTIFISSDASSWIALTSPQNRALRTDKFYLKVSENNTYDNRSATIIIKDKYSNLNAELLITQNQKDGLILTSNLVWVEENGGNIDVELRSNVDYEITMPNTTWLTKNANIRGLTTYNHKFVVSKYTDRYSRYASIIFKDKKTALADTLVVIQKSSKNGLYKASDLAELSNELNIAEIKRSQLILSKYGNYDKNTDKWTFRLMDNINLNPSAVFNSDGSYSGSITNAHVPIGKKEIPFSNIFEGNNYKLSGLYINGDSSSYLGLFGYIKNAQVRNTHIASGNITCSKASSSVGAISGYNESSVIDKCSNGSSITILEGGCNTGGICGENESGKIYNSSNSGLMKAIHPAGKNIRVVLGGICGRSLGGTNGGADEYITIENCFNTGKISATYNCFGTAGGICGWNLPGFIVACYNTGSIEGNFIQTYLGYGFSAGGISGNGSKAIACYNTGNIVSDWYGEAGGINGFSSSEIGSVACYNVGMIKSENGQHNVGGICGKKYNLAGFSTSFWLEGTALKQIGNGKWPNDDLIGKMTSAEMRMASQKLNDGIQVWNKDNPTNKCKYVFYNRGTDYPGLKLQ